MSNKIDLRKRFALELSRKLHKSQTKLHTLHTLFWECTLRCNAACRHCGSDCRTSSIHPDMPINDFLQVIDDLRPHVDPHRVMVVFTGGEALVREDLEKCGIELYRREFPWGIVSNGQLLTRSRLDSLLAAGMHSATISLDGLETSHNWLRGNKFSFQGTYRAIRMLAEEKEIVWDVVTCVNRKNFCELTDLKKMLVEAGVKRWRLFTIFPVGRAAKDPDLQLSDCQFTALLEFIKACRKEGKITANFTCEGFLGNYEGEVRDHLYRCDAGIGIASILIDGSISGCTSIRSNFHQGNIYSDRFHEVWENRFQVYRNREWAKKGDCETCKMFRYCEGNGMHLYDEKGRLLTCHYHKIAP